MTSDTQLAVRLEARIRDFERKMAQAEKRASRTYAHVTKGSARAARQVEKDMGGAAANITAAFKTASRGLIAGLSIGAVTAASQQIAQLAENVAAVGDEAKRAGVNVEAFQELRYVAEQARIGVDSLTDGLKEMNLRADEFVFTGKGPAAEAFQRLGYTAEELSEKLEDPSALFSEIIGKLGKLDRAAQIRIADEIFGGTGGEKFVQLIAQGEEGIRDQIQAARDLGIVMDEEVIAKAAELDRMFQTVTKTVGVSLQTAIINAASALAGFIDSFREFENQQSRTLQTRLTDLGRQRLDIENDILQAREAQSELSENALNLGFGERANIDVARMRQEMEAIAAEEARILGILADRRESKPPTVPEFIPTEVGGAESLPGGRSSTASATRDTTQAIREQIAVLQEELRLVGATDLQYAISAELRRAGADATADQKAQITGLVSAIYAEEKAVRMATAAQQEMRDLSRDVLGSFVSDLRSGVSAADALENSLGRIADRLINMALDQSINALFGSLGGGLGGGGDPWAGMRSTGGGGGIGSLISSGIGMLGGLFGFKDGGVTGVYHLEIAGALK